METSLTQVKVGKLAESWQDRNLRANPEYQRGLAWSVVQQQRFVDSILRGYPLPLFFLRKINKTNFDGQIQSTYEIIDGQQRIHAAASFQQGNFACLSVDDPKLSLPDSIRASPAPWAGKHFDNLDASTKARFQETEVQVIMVEGVTTEDEVRDLFIRLQAGTALSRQQIRDAWPGPIGPFVERLAGKNQKQPSSQVFFAIDRRGRRKASEDEEAEDPYVDHRQTCAQLLLLFTHRKRNAHTCPTLSPSNLDDLYHRELAFDVEGEDGEQFRELMSWMDEILGRGATAVRKNQLFSMFAFLHELQANSSIAVTDQLVNQIRDAYWDNETGVEEPKGRVTSSTTLENHLKWFARHRLAKVTVPSLDPKRFFSAEQKDELWERSQDEHGMARCNICGGTVERNSADFDHIEPWLRGGQTTLTNGRVVHRIGKCHKRGRQAVELT